MYPDIEQQLLGCVVYGKRAGEVFAQVEEYEIHDERLRRIYGEYKEVWHEKGTVDIQNLLGLPDELKKDGYIAYETMYSSDPQQAIDALKERNASEKAQIIGAKLMGAYGMDELRELSEELMKALQATEPTEIMTMDKAVEQFADTKTKPRQYIHTGFSRLDGYTYMDRGDYVVIGARPSNGKTALAINMAVKIARQGYKVGFFSLETSSEKVFDRIVAAETGILFERIKRQTLDGDDWKKYADEFVRLQQLPLTIIPTAGKSVSWIQSESLRLMLDVVIIDYLGLIKSPGRDLREVVTRTSRDLHVYAQSSKKLVIALCQLNRAGDGREPKLVDLREAGEIEENADEVLLIYNPASEERYRPAKLIVAKNKEGIAGVADDMLFEGAIQRFTEVTHDY